MATPRKPAPHNFPGRPERYSDQWCHDEAIALLEWIKDADDDDKKNYIGSFAAQRGFPRQKLSLCAEKNQEFHDAYEAAKLWQENKFIRKGLSREWDPGFTKYVMARVCGPEWKNSWDQPVERVDTPTTVIINKL